MAASYISEHSAEYYLVPALKTILQEEYSHIAPVFPWISRELSNISKHLHKDDWFHVLVMFPRRPKIDGTDDFEVYVTINRELEYFSKAGKEKGVPVIAGCPMAMNLWDLSDSNTHAWIDLSQINCYEHLNPISNLKKMDICYKERTFYLL